MSDSSPMIDHIAIAVDDLDKSISFYCDGLKYEVLERRETIGSSTGMISAVLRGQGVIIVLVQGTEPESQVSRFVKKHGAGVQHLAIAVPNIESTLLQLGREDGEPEIPIIEGDGIRQVFLKKSPGSGVRIELIERNGGSFNDASVEMLFKEFEKRGAI